MPWAGFLLGLMLFPLFLLGHPSAAAPLVQPTPTPSTVFYRVFVSQTPHGGPPILPLDIEGVVRDRSGQGQDGLRVRVSWPSGGASDVSKGGGFFKFTLTQGVFTVQLADVPSETATIGIDGRSHIRVEFREGAPARPSPSPTPTVLPTLVPTAFASPTPGSTPRPTSTPILIMQPAVTKTPSADTPQPTPTVGLGGALLELPLSLLGEVIGPIDVQPWVDALLWGMGAGAAVFFGGLLVLILRR